MGVRSVGAEIRSLPVLAAILNFELSDLNLYSYMFYIPSLVGVRSLGAEIWTLPVLDDVINLCKFIHIQKLALDL